MLLPRRFAIALIILMSLCSGCTSVRYYAHVARGQTSLLLDRRPIARVVADPATDARTAARLGTAGEAREFASTTLKLPRNRSYTYFVELNRPAVVWNVFATPELSLVPVTHCFPVAGCVAYRGYFSKDLADAEAKRLHDEGDDVYVGDVPAYSTLGWFADPILSSMLRWDDDELVGTIFHELAHQKLYVKDDTAFNESYASFVEEEGVRQWRQAKGLPPPDQAGAVLTKAFTQQVMDLRDRLAKLYTSDISVEMKRAGKANEIVDFRERYAVWRDTEGKGDRRYDRWVAAPINNARLLPFGLYDQWTASFARVFADAHGDWDVFFAEVRRLSKLKQAVRDEKLKALATTP
ncbi:putative aminopeptidase [Luteibacter rhizovicinus]|uniref:Putative aminopeptidase n=1 Tax=Luteibacter rhizovicinus TaxID=242606 RepID=A0A4R3YNW8_9GAMM|nr:aminopeptidase [Luteibacter rhizovicinus]TCV93238.1 putative aminopeptidase [Luteibacter rhizovicinus]